MRRSLVVLLGLLIAAAAGMAQTDATPAEKALCRWPISFGPSME